MRTVKLACGLMLGVVAGLLVLQQMRWDRRLTALQTAQETSANAATDKLADVRARLQETLLKLERLRLDLESAEVRLAQHSAQIDNMQRDLNALAQRSRERGPLPTGDRLTFVPPQALAEPGKRSWGPEQVVGPPDTFMAGDITTAWASRSPDAGEEWLKVDYEKAVDLAEVRVRETYNPGAISKVAAVLADGQEVTIWEGTELPAAAPVDTSFPVTDAIRASVVKIYLDTRRVPGWNEIDAVELVGRDGSRQWAKSASASSSFADR
jgi:hypothetical protein